MDSDVHALRPGVDQPRFHFHHVADQQRPVEAHSTGKDGHRVHPAVPGGADVGCFVDPFHDDAAVHLAAPVHIGGCGHKAQDHILGGPGAGVFLSAHRLDDVFADFDPRQGMVALFDFIRRHGHKLRHGDRLAVLAHSHENHHALAAHRGRAALRIARGHHGPDVHGGPARVDNRRLHFNHVPAVDRIREVDVPHVGRHAIGLGPAHRGGVGSLVHPFEDRASINRTAVADVGGGCKEAQGHGVGGVVTHGQSLLTGRVCGAEGDTIAHRNAISGAPSRHTVPGRYNGGRPPGGDRPPPCAARRRGLP